MYSVYHKSFPLFACAMFLSCRRTIPELILFDFFCSGLRVNRFLLSNFFFEKLSAMRSALILWCQWRNVTKIFWKRKKHVTISVFAWKALTLNPSYSKNLFVSFPRVLENLFTPCFRHFRNCVYWDSISISTWI